VDSDGEPSFVVTFLGTRDAAVGRGVNTTSQLVTHGTTDVLIDAGIGVAAQLREAGLTAGALEAVVLTHWHPDHVAGLPSLLRGDQGGFGPVRVYGPRPPSQLWWSALRFGSLRRVAATLEVVEVGATLELGSLRLSTYATDHGTPSLGWSFAERTGDRVVAIPGDSRPTNAIVDAARGADLLVFEATFLDRDADRAAATRHSTAREAATLASRAGVGTLALTHLSDRYPRTDVAAEAARSFGSVIVPDDMDRVHLGPRPRAGHAPVALERR
jgi:ribonuclease Z